MRSGLEALQQAGLQQERTGARCPGMPSPTTCPLTLPLCYARLKAEFLERKRAGEK